MKHHLNTLFVTTQGAYLRKDGEAVAVRIAEKTRVRVPFINIQGIVCFGRVGCSPALLGVCANRGIPISFFTIYGKLLAIAHGFSPGNVLVRRTQYRWADDPRLSADVARCVVIGKLANCRSVLRRAGREHSNPSAAAALSTVADQMTDVLRQLETTRDLDSVRGIEGHAAAAYFSVFSHLITNPSPEFQFVGRSRRPPRDPVNALLSFLYSLLLADVRGACEAAGLDAAVGFLHRDRPGRPGLALDLMEELRPLVADRVALNLINRQQLKKTDFRSQPTGAVLLSDNARRTLLQAYQEKKQELITHPVLNEKMTLGLVPHIQARLFARFLRGEVLPYLPFVPK